MDDVSGVLVNAALIAALTPLLIGIGNALKTLPPFRAAPEWVTVVNLVLGPGMAVAYTWARADSAHVPATSVEMVIAALSGVAAALASSHIYDATRASLGHSAKARARRQTHAPPRG